MEQPELVMKFLTVLGAPLTSTSLRFKCLTEVYDPGHLPEWPLDVNRMSIRKTSSLDCSSALLSEYGQRTVPDYLSQLRVLE